MLPFSPTDVAELLKWLADHGIWDMLTTLAAVSIGVFIRTWYRHRVPGFSVHVTYTVGTGHPLYPNTLNFEVRNLRDAPLLVLNPNFRFGRQLKAGNAAHGNTATGDYEIKFRPIDAKGVVSDWKSYTTIMLRHRDAAFAYVPFADGLTEKDLQGLIEAGKLGTLTLHVVLIRDPDPQVVAMSIPVRRISRAAHKPPLGGDAHPKAAPLPPVESGQGGGAAAAG
jgi:hypothetical protein